MLHNVLHLKPEISSHFIFWQMQWFLWNKQLFCLDFQHSSEMCIMLIYLATFYWYEWQECIQGYLSVCQHFIWRTNRQIEANFDEFSYEHYTMRTTLYSHTFNPKISNINMMDTWVLEVAVTLCKNGHLLLK